MSKPPTVEVVQEGRGFFVQCSIHGRITPEPDKLWAGHMAAGVACGMHGLFAFHGKGAGIEGTKEQS